MLQMFEVCQAGILGAELQSVLGWGVMVEPGKVLVPSTGATISIGRFTGPCYDLAGSRAYTSSSTDSRGVGRGFESASSGAAAAK